MVEGLLGVGPNPFRENVTVNLALARTDRVLVRVFDVQGRVVRTLGGQALPAGRHQFTWNGRGSGGEALGSGVYFLRVEAGDQVWSRKVLHLR